MCVLTLFAAGCSGDDNGVDSEGRGLVGKGDLNGVSVRWFPDADKDGQGDWYRFLDSAVQPPGFVKNNTDCDDSDRNTFSPLNGAPGGVDRVQFDGDCDGKGLNAVLPAPKCVARPMTPQGGMSQTAIDALEQAERVGKKVVRYADCDGDGSASWSADCDDANQLIYPGSVEVRYDGLNNDCNVMTADSGYNRPYVQDRFVALRVDPGGDKGFRG